MFKQYLPLTILDSTNLFCEIKNIILILNFFKLHIKMKYTQISDLIAVDLVNTKYQFLLVYSLLSISGNKRMNIKSLIQKNDLLESSSCIFKASNWLEREVWDMFGLYFINHPDLRRILNDYNFEGFPLLKDFPVSGFYDLRYSEILKMITFEEIILTQQNRF